ncbi:MAG: ABC transporter permease, partial [Chloroflexota bacterium]|nr:ABC transporter permease [Chloroflexota bacterium]
VTMTSLGVGVQMELERNIRAVGLETIFTSPRVVERDNADPFAPAEVARPITPALVEEIESLPGVESVAPTIELPFNMDIRIHVGDESAPIRLITDIGQDIFEPDPEPLAGRILQPGDRSGVVVSERTAEQLGRSPEALVSQPATLLVTTPRGEQTEIPTTIEGVSSFEGRRTYIGVEERAAIKAWWYNRPDFLEEDGYDSLLVQARSIEAVPAVSEALEALDLETQSLQQVLDLAARIFAVLQTLLASVGILALFVASLGVVNTMIMAIYERTREIGVLKATGAAPGDIHRLFMVEAALMGFMGGLTGVIFGTLLGKFIDWLAHRYLESEQITGIGALSVVPPWLALGALLFGTLVGLLAGLYPAARAARLDPVQALRYD